MIGRARARRHVDNPLHPTIHRQAEERGARGLERQQHRRAPSVTGGRDARRAVLSGASAAVRVDDGIEQMLQILELFLHLK